MEQVTAYTVAVFTAIVDNAPFLVGFIMPPIVEVLNRDITSSQGRLVVSLLLCFLAAVVLHWNEIAFGNPEQVVAIAGIIFTEAHVTYKFYFADSYLRSKIRREDVVEEEPLGEIEAPNLTQ